jgi:uroporphyrinogen decarboxylase
VAISPFSLPVMQMGFDRYLELIYDNPTLFWYLMEQNITFCVNWANAQLEAGATAICYFDPVSSPTIIPKDLYMRTGYTIAVDTLKQIKGPTATHLASGRSLPIANELATTGTAIIGVSAEESMKELKEAYKNKLTIIGNLNGIAMRNWSPSDTRRHVLQAIREGARGGGFILSDNHGEIPWQVPEEVLMTISETVREFGTYPIQL